MMKKKDFDNWIYGTLLPDGKNIDLQRLAIIRFLAEQLRKSNAIFAATNPPPLRKDSVSS